MPREGDVGCEGDIGHEGASKDEPNYCGVVESYNPTAGTYYHCFLVDLGLPPPDPCAFSGSAKNNPDIFTYEQAMAFPEPERSKWRESMLKEIRTLESLGSWVEVDVSEPENKKHKIIPSLWVLRYKRTPFGLISSRKSQIVLRGDLEEKGNYKTSAPLVAWSTIRIFILASLILRWPAIQADFDSAFLQATLDHPVYMALPRGFKSR